jgi:hypothetical protein
MSTTKLPRNVHAAAVLTARQPVPIHGALLSFHDRGYWSRFRTALKPNRSASENGERRDVIVELDADEIADARRNLGLDGLVAKSYTMRKASRCVPAGFDPDLSSIKQVQEH